MIYVSSKKLRRITKINKNTGEIIIEKGSLVDASIIKKLNLFADLQTRNIQYNFEGFNNDGTPEEQSVHLNFFNPKFGLFYSIIDKKCHAYQT